MKKSRFTEEQIVMALGRVEAGTPVQEVCRKRREETGKPDAEEARGSVGTDGLPDPRASGVQGHGVSRSKVRCRSRRPSYKPLRARLKELAGVQLSAQGTGPRTRY